MSQAQSFYYAVLAYLVAALAPSMEVANAALPLYVVTLLYYAGFLLRWKNIPNYWKWCDARTPSRPRQAVSNHRRRRPYVFDENQSAISFLRDRLKV